jgi:hypothetical protein
MHAPVTRWQSPHLSGPQNGPQGVFCGPSASQSPPSIHEMPRIQPREPQRFRGFSPVFAGARGSLTNRGDPINLALPKGFEASANVSQTACTLNTRSGAVQLPASAHHTRTTAGSKAIRALRRASRTSKMLALDPHASGKRR